MLLCPSGGTLSWRVGGRFFGPVGWEVGVGGHRCRSAQP